MDIYEIVAQRLGSNYNEKRLFAYMASVGMAEGLGSRTQRQISGKGKNQRGGPAHGLYQIEYPTMKTYRKDLEEIYGKDNLPEWYQYWSTQDGKNASNLGKREQGELLLSPYLSGTKSDKSNFVSFMSGDISAGELAARNHKRSFSNDAERVRYVSKIDKYFTGYNNDAAGSLSVAFDNDWVSPKADPRFSESKYNIVAGMDFTNITPGTTPTTPTDTNSAQYYKNRFSDIRYAAKEDLDLALKISGDQMDDLNALLTPPPKPPSEDVQLEEIPMIDASIAEDEEKAEKLAVDPIRPEAPEIDLNKPEELQRS